MPSSERVQRSEEMFLCVALELVHIHRQPLSLVFQEDSFVGEPTIDALTHELGRTALSSLLLSAYVLILWLNEQQQ